MIKQIYKTTAFVLMGALALSSCSEDAIEPWTSENYIQFAPEGQDFYSFVYSGSETVRDTVTFRVDIAGKVISEDRIFNVAQVKSYGFVYEEDELGNVIDSAFVELANQAIPGIHYVDLAEYNDTFIVPADSLGAELEVVVLRDPSLQTADYTLTLEVQESADFLPGNAATQKVDLTISDQIIEPKLWGNFPVGNTTVFSVMGYYGKVKHQLIIDATGQRWDDDFIENELTEEYLVFYKKLAVDRLNEINAEREAQGLHKLREDDANPNSEIYFF